MSAILPVLDTLNELAAEVDYIGATVAGSGVPEATGLALIIDRWSETLERLASDLAGEQDDPDADVRLALGAFERGLLSRLARIDGCTLAEAASRTLREALRQRVDDDLAKAKEERAS
ncbi:hypothetical protein [Thiobaca trueperi]|uniref:Uncharacterized protein n=1 Tax=Thiobaca trueperi TaxID=127458 RepID=A0A4R3MWZ5_9GAMM|nr:hypothetical protein [Thiobaca trueperi]TCT20277.1 hypothetical protein EDC35_106204 [Thiobaca trueperi]